jgi:hypothetical protein
MKRLLEIFWARVRCLWWCLWRFQCEFLGLDRDDRILFVAACRPLPIAEILRDAKAITKVFYVDKLCR